jgi:hypothetical protein
VKTDDLIAMLATGAGAVEQNAAPRRYALAVGAGAVGAMLLLGVLLGVRPDIADAVTLPMFWVKVAFAGSLAAISLVVAVRLSRPGARLAWVPAALTAPMLLMWALAAVALIRAEPALRPVLFFGETWRSCPFLIALLSVPAFVAALWAMKGLAPTRPGLAGAAAGLLAGATGALVYCLHCPELAAPFLGFWYLLGMLIPTAVGAFLGPRLLRW